MLTKGSLVPWRMRTGQLYVTCPTMRYHPAVVAQKAATKQLLAPWTR